MNKVLFQIGLLLIVACLFGAIFTSLKLNFYLGFIFGILAQYGIYHLFVYCVELYTIIKVKKIEVERIRELSYQGINVTCPCARKINEFVPIRLGTSNYYKCNECQKSVSVFVNTETALVTEPIINTDLNAIQNLVNQTINESTR